MTPDPDTFTAQGPDDGPAGGTLGGRGGGPHDGRSDAPHDGRGGGPQSDPDDGRGEGLDQALDETPGQRYVGARDLTRWPTSAGRFAVRVSSRAAHWIAPRGVLAVTLVIGLVLVAMMALGAAAIYDSVSESDGVAGLDRPALDAAIALRTPLGNDLVAAYTHVGDTPILPLLATVTAIGLGLWWRQWSPVVLIAVTGFGALALTVVGKAAVGRSRPPVVDAVPPFLHSYSFPSGHSLNSMALAGIVAYLLVRRQHRGWARALTISLAAAFAVTMGLSRVYLGAHWLTDVLVAWFLALAWLTVVITAHRIFLTIHRQRLPDPATSPIPAPG